MKIAKAIGSKRGYMSFFIIEYANNMQYLTCILASLIGAAMAFLIFNYNPAKIVMGDSGSYFLGFNLSIVFMNLHFLMPANSIQESRLRRSLGFPDLVS